MPGVEAQTLTREYQQQVLNVAQLIARRLRITAMRADVDDIDGWWDQVAPQVQEEILTGQSALARLARGYLAQHARLEGVSLVAAVVEPDPEQIATSLRVSGPVAFKTHMADSGSETASVRTMASQMQGSATRLVLEGDRQTTMQTFQARDEVEGWRRVAGRSSPCPFCLMLIGRGAVYSKATARFQSHDRCSCKPELLYRREPEPPEVRRLSEQWSQATAGHSGKAAIKAWRRYVTGQRAGRTE
ncbi:hypothetical protein QCN29_26820 [Streptomyces sp. HNM0663]|uniref:Uncharacterized protein n=1 Tax=Streptomyces chengmaiensis TaxID=3040919 RepID=A0ABT6HUF2_9ACTN|nr:hypothetical protein [Streptomyces chengmaiensis]MDH2392325.1 hypothetical protein [Streptomyces chengmaiensis]